MYKKCNIGELDFMENEYIFSIDSAKNSLIDLNEEKILSEEIILLEKEINALQSERNFHIENIAVKYFHKPQRIREFIEISNYNKIHFENSCKSLSKSNKNIELLYKEYTFLSNLTKLRFAIEKSGETQSINNSTEVICYFLKKDGKRYKISVAQFDLREDRLKTAEIFWRNMSLLYCLDDHFRNFELLE